MTQYATDFSDQVIGDWTPRWVTSDVTWTIETSGLLSGVTGGAALVGEVAVDGLHLISWDEIDSDANRDDVEFVMRWQRTEGMSIGATIAALAGRASGSSSSEDAYIGGAIDIDSGTQPRIAKYVSGTRTLLDSGTGGIVAADTWQWVRLRLNGTSIQARYWEDGTSEPGTWQVSATDSDISAAGWVGLLAVERGAGVVDNQVWVDFVGVGTNGDTAPDAPITSFGHGALIATSRNRLVIP